jgi:FkbM family methyltransferase
MLERVKAAVRHSPFAPSARRLYRRFWPLSAAEKNERYDLELVTLMARVLRPDSNCIDVGAHTGAMLEAMLVHAPSGHHLAFEPIPHYAEALRRRFPGVQVHECALSDRRGPVTFHHVVTAPAYSGLRRLNYPEGNQAVETLTVMSERLDDVVSVTMPITLIKVDVEGAELQVFRGASNTIRRCQPFIAFEHGRGGADYYGTTPAAVYDLLVGDLGLKITLLARWLARERPLSRTSFVSHYDRGTDFFFLAHP